MSIDREEKLHGWSVSDPWDIPEFRDSRDKKLVKATRKLPLSVREMIVIVECKVMQGFKQR